jgi:hypothetical protein
MDSNQPNTAKLPAVGSIDPETLNPVVYENIRWTFAKVFGDSDEPQPELPAGLRVPLLDQVIGLRWACQHFIETVESSDLPREKKVHLLGFGVRKFLDAEAELLARV